MEGSKKNIIITALVVFFLCAAIFSFFTFGNNAQNNITNNTTQNIAVENAEVKNVNTENNQAESRVLTENDAEKIIAQKLYFLNDGSVHFSGIVEEVKANENEIVINMLLGDSEKLLKTLKIMEDTKLYTVELDEPLHRKAIEVKLSLADIKAGDFVNILVKEEDGIERKDIFQTIEVCVAKVYVSGL